MGAIKDLWLRLLGKVQELGQLDSERQGPLPSDDELLGSTRTIAETLGAAELLTGNGEDLLEELRDAYNDGRQPASISMDAVVEHVTKGGVDAYVGHSGGGCATIYAGTLSEWPDRNGDRRRAVLAGPGWFDAPGWNKPYGDTSDFYIGPDDDGSDPAVSPEPHTHPAAIAELIVNAVRTVEARRERIAEAVEAADTAFWASIGGAFPEVESGDFPSDATLPFKRAQHQAVAGWLDVNAPEERIAPTRVAADEVVAARKTAAVARLVEHIKRSRIDDKALWKLVDETVRDDVTTKVSMAKPYLVDTPMVLTPAYAAFRASEAKGKGVEGMAALLYDSLGEAKATNGITEAVGGPTPDING